jgi:hypothetical protein
MNKACQFDAISMEIGSLPLAVPDWGLSPASKGKP